MDVILAVLADAANHTNDGSLNILGIRQHINALNTPVQYPQMTAAVLLRASPGERGTPHQLRFFLVDDDGKVIHPPVEMNFRVPVEFSGPDLVMQMIGNMLGVVLPKAGTYRLDVVLDGQSRAQLPLRVNLVTPPPEMQLPPPPIE